MIYSACSLTLLFQSTRLLRGATLKVTHHIIKSAISIHAPLARRDAS